MIHEHVLLCFQAVGGNIMTASPISDLNPVFMAAGCRLTLMDKGNTHDSSGWDKELMKIQTKLSVQAYPPDKQQRITSCLRIHLFNQITVIMWYTAFLNEFVCLHSHKHSLAWFPHVCAIVHLRPLSVPQMAAVKFRWMMGSSRVTGGQLWDHRRSCFPSISRTAKR